MGSSLGSVDTLWILFVLAPRLSVPGCHCLVSGFTFYLQKLVSAYALNQNPHWVESRCPYRLKHPVSIQWHPVMLFSFFSLSWLRLLPLPSPPPSTFCQVLLPGLSVFRSVDSSLLGYPMANRGVSLHLVCRTTFWVGLSHKWISQQAGTGSACCCSNASGSNTSGRCLFRVPIQ